MANEMTIIGNLTSDPALRYSPAGDCVVNFTVASTPRYLDRDTGQWRDGKALFLRCSLWRQAAENVAETLTRGARVIVTGRLTQHTFQTREGDNRTLVELEVTEVGPSLRYATAKITKNPPAGAQGTDRPPRGNGFGRATSGRDNAATDGFRPDPGTATELAGVTAAAPDGEGAPTF
ncbi:single-stranded DNA-binding protein [Nocardia terpenica]|uniref:single-stranded DNA-binding protein n=1 Tax=Nocardia terpenica TaxID=455432 RepID=UPI00189397C8|nr:single-stranded DNA-binding protein [Nocardia terpenica]MBF6063542.1 single-stranded DNA-binding protein [Nocardia terpenica]MBF6106098.1 single-stranded DNA-binding protein [Nocardia terpenica]MBF6113317.1 single-stranded DNA-binding protein [Nocardia terpenica]MBF6119839.1 single-stranded DNA-binding protein [Nocardia terpenica]MBF6152250.1 single-stranded DNA-binding protein [Nocardia terpenica]